MAPRQSELLNEILSQKKGDQQLSKSEASLGCLKSCLKKTKTVKGQRGGWGGGKGAMCKSGSPCRQKERTDLTKFPCDLYKGPRHTSPSSYTTSTHTHSGDLKINNSLPFTKKQHTEFKF